MKIYFAGAIRGARAIDGGREDQKLYLQIIELLGLYGEVLTEHIGDVNLNSSGEELDDKAISARDLAWLDQADILVAEVTTPSLGVGFELGKATEWKKRVLCLYRPADGRSLSAMIAGDENIHVCEYRDVAALTAIFNSFFAANDSGATS